MSSKKTSTDPYRAIWADDSSQNIPQRTTEYPMVVRQLTPKKDIEKKSQGIQTSTDLANFLKEKTRPKSSNRIQIPREEHEKENPIIMLSTVPPPREFDARVVQEPPIHP